ncbi:MAG: hypothetical protein RJQ04_14395 [Longimicrobiales bacterium]
MNCSEAREGLWPPEQPRLAAEEVVAARAHVASCAECRAFFAQDRALLDAYHRLRGTRVPDDLRTRVMAALDDERSAGVAPTAGGASDGSAAGRGGRAWRGALIGGAAVAALSLGALATGVVPGPRGGAAAPDAFVHDYMRRAVGQEFLESSDPAEVRRFITRELGVMLEPMVLPGLELERAEICLLDGHRGVVIVYSDGTASVSHYVVPMDGLKARAPRLDDGDAQMGARMPVVTWASESLDQALVGDLDAESLLWLARVGSGH